MALLIAGCGLLGGDDDNDDEQIQIRIFNKTGFDFEWYRLRISLADSIDFEVFEFEFPELSDGEKSEYVHIPKTTFNIQGYSIRLSYFSEHFGFQMNLRLRSDFDDDRAEPITNGNYTYIAEYTSHDFVFYRLFHDEKNEENVRIRFRNVSELDFDQVMVWLLTPPEEAPVNEYVTGPIPSGHTSEYEAVEGAAEFTKIEVITSEGDTLDNMPIDHFAYELPPGDYTYEVEIRTTNLKDNSRLVKD